MRKIAVFGYGAVGRETTAKLTARGDNVRVVQRYEPKNIPKGSIFQFADSTDRDATIAACAGVDTVICCIGLRYISTVWQHDWPAVMANLIDGCSLANARLIFADNLYMYGPQTAPLTEDMPLTTYGRKPALRAAITKQWKSAHDAGRVRAVAVRASDFYGPDVATSVISGFGVARLLAGQPVLSPYPTDQLHDFVYVPDFARALISLADGPDDAYGQAWHVPHAPTRSLRDVLTLAASLIGVPPRITVVPAALVPLIGLVSKEVGETGEMRFQWNRPYLVDASKFNAHFWNDPTTFETGLGETVAFYRAALTE
ncbi:MAG TPA: NAD-dependent epimerase/dehydratase family protein [Candidatus Eremiobacteraceae bacterium]